MSARIVDAPERLKSFFDLIQAARADQLLLAYHDRSDGGAFAALCEMAFASRMGLELSLDALGRRRVLPSCSTRNLARSCRSPPRIAQPSPIWSTAMT